MKVIITGAGIGGLTTALWLHHLGIDCQVYEQGTSIGELGVGIYAHRLGPEMPEASIEYDWPCHE